MDSSPLRNRLLVVAAALLFSTGGAAFKATTFNAWQVAGIRSGIAAAVLLAALPEARRWSLRIVPIAFAYAATLVSFVIANKLTTSANAIFLQSTAPFYLLFLGPLLLREPVRRADVLFLLGVLAGASLVFAGTQSAMATAPNPAAGNAVALVSGVTYAFTLAGLRWLSRRGGADSSLAATALGNVIACVCALPFGLPIPHAAPLDIAVLLYLGIFQIGLAYICLTRALRRVSAVEATTLLMVEPAMNPVWTWTVHGENPGALPIVGGAMILAAGLVNTWRRARADAAAAASAQPS